MDVYQYCGALYCYECTGEILAGHPVPSYPKPWDSNDYPYGPIANGGGEADSPSSCDSCHIFLENPLTEEGENYVRDALLDPGGSQEVKTEWALFYDYLQESALFLENCLESPE